MIKKTSSKVNFIYNAIYQILLIVCPLITAPYISRILGAEQIGVYSYTHSFAYYFYIIAMLGVNNYGNRSCAMVRDNKEELSKTFWSIYYFQAFCSLIAIVVYFSYVVFCGDSDKQLVMFAQGIYVISVLFDINWFFFGLEQFRITVTRNIVIKLLTVILTFVLVRDRSDIVIYTALMTVGALITQLSVWPFLRGRVNFVRPRWCEIKRHIKPNIILFVPVIAISLYKYMDKIMIGMLSTMTQSGYYENTEKIINIPSGFITALGTVMLPRMSNLIQTKGEEAGRKITEKSMIFAMFMACAFCFGLAGIANIFVPLYLGEEFQETGRLVIWIAPTILFTSWANVIRTQYLIPSKMDREYIKSVFYGAIVNIIINTALIPNYGAWGAVIGTVFAEGTVCVSQTYMVRKNLPILSYIKQSVPFLGFGLVMFVVVLFIGDVISSDIVALVVQVLGGAAIYLVLSAVYIFAFRPKSLEYEIDEISRRLLKKIKK